MFLGRFFDMLSKKARVKNELFFGKFVKKILSGGESNPGLPRDRRGYWPLYYRRRWKFCLNVRQVEQLFTALHLCNWNISLAWAIFVPCALNSEPTDEIEIEITQSWPDNPNQATEKASFFPKQLTE